MQTHFMTGFFLSHHLWKRKLKKKFPCMDVEFVHMFSLKPEPKRKTLQDLIVKDTQNKQNYGYSLFLFFRLKMQQKWRTCTLFNIEISMSTQFWFIQKKYIACNYMCIFFSLISHSSYGLVIVTIIELFSDNSLITLTLIWQYKFILSVF